MDECWVSSISDMTRFVCGGIVLVARVLTIALVACARAKVGVFFWNTEWTVDQNWDARWESPSTQGNETMRLNVKSYGGCSLRKRATIGWITGRRTLMKIEIFSFSVWTLPNRYDALPIPGENEVSVWFVFCWSDSLIRCTACVIWSTMLVGTKLRN